MLHPKRLIDNKLKEFYCNMLHLNRFFLNFLFYFYNTTVTSKCYT